MRWIRSALGHRAAVLLGFVVFALPACSGGGSGTGGASSVFGGSWQGTWQNTALAAGGTVTLDLVQHGTSVVGTATFDQHPCMTTCSVSWQAMGSGCSGQLDAGSFQIDFEGSCGGPGHGDLSGHFDVHGGACDGQSGTMSLTRMGQSASLGQPATHQVGELILIGTEDSDLVRLPIVEPSGN